MDGRDFSQAFLLRFPFLECPPPPSRWHTFTSSLLFYTCTYYMSAFTWERFVAPWNIIVFNFYVSTPHFFQFAGSLSHITLLSGVSAMEKQQYIFSWLEGLHTHRHSDYKWPLRKQLPFFRSSPGISSRWLFLEYNYACGSAVPHSTAFCLWHVPLSNNLMQCVNWTWTPRSKYVRCSYTCMHMCNSIWNPTRMRSKQSRLTSSVSRYGKFLGIKMHQIISGRPSDSWLGRAASTIRR